MHMLHVTWLNVLSTGARQIDDQCKMNLFQTTESRRFPSSVNETNGPGDKGHWEKKASLRNGGSESLSYHLAINPTCGPFMPFFSLIRACMCMDTHTAGLLWRSEDNPRKSAPCLHSVGPRDQTQCMSFAGKCLLLTGLSLTRPLSRIFESRKVCKPEKGRY